jgi:hypothetical protein
MPVEVVQHRGLDGEECRHRHGQPDRFGGQRQHHQLNDDPGETDRVEPEPPMGDRPGQHDYPIRRERRGIGLTPQKKHRPQKKTQKKRRRNAEEKEQWKPEARKLGALRS